MNGRGKSDSSVVPVKPSNNGGAAAAPAAERVEGRGLPKGNLGEQNRSRAQIRPDLQNALDRVRQAAVGDRKLQLTTLWHHVYNVDRLREAYLGLKRKAAPGVDRVTWHAYGETLEENLQDLSARLKRGAYRAKPVKRTYIPKEDGRQRPLGVTSLEDKIVQRVTVEVLNAVYGSDDDRFLADLRERFAKFCLELHPDKTRLIEFGRFASENRRRRGEGKPETFDFLGFTHCCDRIRNGKLIVLRQTMKKRMRRKLKEVKAKLRQRLHDPIPEVGTYLRSVVSGHFRYYGVPRNGPALASFRHALVWMWWRSVQRRTQRHRSKRKLWRRFWLWVTRFIPSARILHPYPEQRLRVMTQGRSPVR